MYWAIVLISRSQDNNNREAFNGTTFLFSIHSHPPFLGPVSDEKNDLKAESYVV